jgi:hypothetical protein
MFSINLFLGRFQRVLGNALKALNNLSVSPKPNFSQQLEAAPAPLALPPPANQQEVQLDTRKEPPRPQVTSTVPLPLPQEATQPEVEPPVTLNKPAQKSSAVVISDSKPGSKLDQMPTKAAQKAKYLMTKVKTRIAARGSSKKLKKEEASKNKKEAVLEEKVAVVAPIPFFNDQNKDDDQNNRTTSSEKSDDYSVKRKKPDMLSEDDACDIAVLFNGQPQYWGSGTAMPHARKKASPSSSSSKKASPSSSSSLNSNDTFTFVKPTEK